MGPFSPLRCEQLMKRLRMIAYSKCSLSVLGILLFSMFATATRSYSQTGYAEFGNVYGGQQQFTINVSIPGTEAVMGYFNGGGSTSNSAGTVSSASSFFSAGQGQPIELPVTFAPNGNGGTIGGEFTANYSCNTDCSQDNLSIDITVDGDDIIASAVAGVKYQTLAILYDPPGDASSSGFSTTVSSGAATSISNNFSDTTNITFGGGFLGINNQVQFSVGSTSGNSSSFTTSYQATGGPQLQSPKQAMDHTLDEIYLLVDPSIKVTQTGETSGSYLIGPSLDATGDFGAGGTPPDIMNMNVAGFQNPTSIPLSYLKPQVVKVGTTLPGLAYVCANPLPPDQCTPQNACGCTSSDFAPIVAQDELANETDQSTQPDTIDAARFVYIGYEPLEGPQQEGAGPVSFTYSISDGYMNSETTSNGTSYSVGYSRSFSLVGPFTLNITADRVFTFSQTQTAGKTNGVAHTATVTLGSSDVGCEEYVDIYEDTTYHTFAYALSQPPPSNCQ